MNIFAKLSRSGTSTATCVAHVRLWHFIASVEEALHPSLRSQPLVMTGAREQGERILDANDLARSLGARTGMRVAIARTRIPRLVARSWNYQRGEGFRRAFRTLAARWGRVVSVTADGQSATLIIPVANALERAAIFLHIQQACWRELECNVVVGMGPTAHFALLAASSCAEPGFRYLDNHEEATLRTIPVASIPKIGRRTARALVHLGVPTAWHFLQLQRGDVRAHGGPTLARLHGYYATDVQPLPFRQECGPLVFPGTTQIPRPLSVAA